MIYHSEDSDLDKFVYISLNLSHSSSFSVFTQNFERPGLLLLQGEWNRAHAPRGTYAQIFLRFGLSYQVWT